MGILFHGDVAKIRSFEAEQAQAHKTTIFSGVSMTVPPLPPAHSPDASHLPPSPSPEGASYMRTPVFFINLRLFKSRLITIRLRWTKHDCSTPDHPPTPPMLRICPLAVPRGGINRSSPLHLFPDLLDLNLRLYGGILNLYRSYDIIYLM